MKEINLTYFEHKGQLYIPFKEHVEILEDLQKRIDKAIEYIERNCILSDCWKDLDFCNFVPIGKIKYKSLSSKKVKDLLDILKGVDKE